MMLAHRIALAPNNVQATYLSRAAGTARFAYNWALAQWKQQDTGQHTAQAIAIFTAQTTQCHQA